METVIIRVSSKRDRQKLINYSINNGWQAQSFNERLNEFIETAPQNVPITDDEILAEIKQVRQDAKSLKTCHFWLKHLAIGKRLNELRIALTHPKVEVFVCQKLLWEVRVTTQKPKLLKYISQDRQKMLLELMHACQCVSIVEQISISRDSNDDYLLDLAVTADADFLVTGDNDLLILKNYHNTNIISFASFMAVIDTL